MNKGTVHFYDLHPPIADLKKEVLQGLSSQPKAISPKFFYDEYGSRLFDKITELPEYYLTRTEINILREHSYEMISFFEKDCLLIELGSGSSLKTRVLLDALHPVAYMPIDISKEHLLKSVKILATDYPDLDIHAICADYANHFRLPYDPNDKPKTAFFPGSSIGNFEPNQAQALLRRVAEFLGVGNILLIGVDVKKDRQRLNAAYNDAAGVTAAFNLNLLTRINRELDADFELSRFHHHAFHNELQGRVEMHLVSKIPHEVQVDGRTFQFEEGESIHTENSYKYTMDQFQNLVSEVGFQPMRVWTDVDNLFSVHCLKVR